MNWILLLLAGLCEIGWAAGMKYSLGFTKLYPTIFTLTMMAASVIFLALAMRTIPLGTSYAVWTGIGTIGAAVAGMILFHEPATALRILCLCLIAAGIAGLKILSAK